MTTNYLARTALSLALAASIAGPAQAANGLLWRNSSSGATYQFVLDANKIVAEQDTASLAAPWLPVGQGDFNGDGDDDIFWRNSTTGDNKIQLFKNGVATGFTDYDRIADTGWTLVGTGDLNGDKTTDLLWRHKTTQELYSQLVNNGRMASEKLLFKVPEAAWKVATVRDFNADGKADLLFRHDGKGYLYLINMNGNQIASEHDMFTVGDLNWQIAGVDDVNGDKKADIVWRNKSSGDNYLVTLNNHTVLAEGDLPKVADLNWKLLQVTDLTGDGKAELIWKHATTNEVVSHSISGYQLTNEQTLVRPPMGWDLLFVPKVIRTVTPVLTQVAVTPSSSTLEIGQTQTLSVKGTYSDNSNKDLAASSLSWTSSNTAVASIINGVAKGLTAGSSQICAVSGSIKGCADLKINPVTKLNLAFSKPTSWGASAYIYAWANGVEPYGKWPGTLLSLTDSLYNVAVPVEYFTVSSCLNLIFNDGGTNKTADLKRCTTEGDALFKDGTWQQPVISNVELMVTNGTGSGTYKTGNTVNVTANAAPTGLAFVNWSGSGAAYLANTKAASTTLTIPKDQTQLTLMPVYDDLYEAGRERYEAICSSCHGLKGEGAGGGIPLTFNIQTRYTLASLTKKITDTMPPRVGTIVECKGDCATNTAAYIWAGLPQKPANYCDLKGVAPEKRQLRLLTNTEYRNSLRDIFGLSTTVLDNLSLPSDKILDNGFTNDVNRVVDSSLAIQLYLDASLKATESLSLSTLAPSCASDKDCQINKIGRKLFRRALSATELSTYKNLASQTSDTQMLATLLNSPYFLFRSELGDKQVANGYQLTDWEIATALSYGIWESAPDDSLLDLAEKGQLNTTAQIKTQVQRLLADNKARSSYKGFVGTWLKTRIASRDGITETLRSAIQAETETFVEQIAFSGGKVGDLFTANYSYMNDELARHYGITSVAGSTLQKVTYGAGDTAQRQGLLSQASYLVGNAKGDATPIVRGLFVRHQLLCQDLPPPSGLIVPPFEATQPGETLKQKLLRHTKSETCGGCHQYIDGVGLGLERFNQLGKYEAIQNGLNIEQGGEVRDMNVAKLDPRYTTATHDIKTYTNGVKELSQLLSQSSQVQACYTRQYYRYQAGHREHGASECNIEQLNKSATSLSDVILQYTQSANFGIRQ